MKNLISTEDTHIINRICSDYNIIKYKINSDGSIDVNGDVNLSSKQLTKIPLKFNKVLGHFYCHGNKLTSLEGCPVEVGGNFYAHSNHLKNLDYCPKTVEFDFNCGRNDLVSLEGCVINVKGSFDCSFNKLTSLEYCPSKIGNYGFYCMGNKLTSLKWCPTEVRYFNCTGNELTSLEYFPTTIERAICHDNPIPNVFYDKYIKLSLEESQIFFKYQAYYDVWTPELNIDGLNELMAEIKDGLR